MKKTIVFSILLIVGSCFAGTTIAQENFDKLVMLNGDEHIGKVTEMNTDVIKFVHQNESLVYSYNKSDIHKIQFGSGRIEIINESTTTDSGESQLQDHHNVVAVLPFSFIGEGGASTDELSKKVQNDCYNVMLQLAREFKIQDPVYTNATLIKHNINSQNIAGFTPEELCHILGAEYIVIGGVTVLFTGSVSSGSQTKTKKDKDSKSTSYTFGSSSSYDKYKTQVELKMYSDQGQNIFSKSHESFWQTQDAYIITLQWLIKRSPLYRK